MINEFFKEIRFENGPDFFLIPNKQSNGNHGIDFKGLNVSNLDNLKLEFV